ncbi:MAG: thiamine pyrophosphate-requiring protein [Dehalococcoidia bacterium]|nr:thiamine pyrophosphate-requiring protein [Dehalococcoidia bacterium]
MKGGAVITNILKAEGTEYVFSFPNNPLIDEAAKTGIRPIIGRVERTIINMADGYARAANGAKPSVCMVQYGPGIENAYGGIAQAYSDSIPLLVLPSGPPRSRLGLPVSYDPVYNYRGITKWLDSVRDAGRAAAMLRRAFSNLRTGRPAPVLLEVPSDVVQDEVSDAAAAYRPVKGSRSSGDPSDVREAVRALLAAKRPVLHAGQGVLWAEASPELLEFAELVQAPVMTTTLGKSAFPEAHPLALGVGATSGTGMVNHFLSKADLLFSVGASLSTTLASCTIPAGKTMIQCTIDERDLNAEYALDHAVIGDAKLVLRQLIDEAKRQLGEGARPGGQAVAAEVASVKQAWIKEWMPKLTSNETPLNPYRVFWDMNNTLDRPNSMVTHDSGNVRDQLVPFYESTTPRSYLGWGNSTPLGFSLGVTLGAKLARPEKMCVNVLGDTAFGMCGMDFETAVRERIPILTVLINNSAMGGYEKYLAYSAEHYRTKYLTGNYLKVAEGLGYSCERVEQPGEIVPALQRAMKVVKSGHPALVEFITKEEYEFSKAI